jgi:hypothetical protein
MQDALCARARKGNRGIVLNEGFGKFCYDFRMTKRSLTFFALLGACLWLVGCGGGGGAAGGGGTPAPDPRLARLDAYEAQKIRVLGDPGTGISAMPLAPVEAIPTNGTASFIGSATIRVELQGNPLVLYGDAMLDMDFGSGSVSGSLDNFFGATAQSRVDNFQGDITVTGGTPAQDMMLAYSGSLATTDQTLDFMGMLAEIFLGNPVTAIAAVDLEAVVDRNGAPQNATIIVLGEGAVIPPTAPP